MTYKQKKQIDDTILSVILRNHVEYMHHLVRSKNGFCNAMDYVHVEISFPTFALQDHGASRRHCLSSLNHTSSRKTFQKH